MHISQPLIALTARQKSSKVDFVRRRVGDALHAQARRHLR
jgi:hypothetical protein